MEPKLYKDMGIKQYHDETDFISKSMLCDFADCPARFKHRYIDGGAKKESKSLRIGNAVHTLALEPELWKSGYYVLPKTYYNDKAEEKPFKNDLRMQVVQDEFMAAGYNVFKDEDGKWQAEETEKSKIVLTPAEFEQVEQMAAALNKNAYAVSLLSGAGYVEASIFWEQEVEDPETGEIVKVKLRCRPDKMCNSGLIVDLKTARSVKPALFNHDAYNYNYHLSVALTFMGYEALYGKPPEEYAFIGIEGSEPYIVECFGSTKPMDELTGLSYLDFGRMHLNKLLQQYVVCKRTGIWPGYQEEIGDMAVPKWALREFIENGEF